MEYRQPKEGAGVPTQDQVVEESHGIQDPAVEDVEYVQSEERAGVPIQDKGVDNFKEEAVRERVQDNSEERAVPPEIVQDNSEEKTVLVKLRDQVGLGRLAEPSDEGGVDVRWVKPPGEGLAGEPVQVDCAWLAELPREGGAGAVNLRVQVDEDRLAEPPDEGGVWRGS